MTNLAILGGTPLRAKVWPKWPVVSPLSRSLLSEALDSGRWTISGQALVPARFDREIGQLWANYIGVRHALPCATGTAGLTMALEALGIGPGDEVIVPGMTWVACPQTVYNVGATPVIVDVDPQTLSMDPSAVRSAMTSRTKAMLVVHAYCGLADLDALITIATDYSIPIIEDGSQAHGAEWRGRRVGSFGTISVFSTQQSKLLTSGEGGLVATDDGELFIRLQHLRMDGRHYDDAVSLDNWMCISGHGQWQGRNFNPTEMMCALLIGGLADLDSQTERREGNIERLAEMLARNGGAAVTPVLQGVTRRAAWRLTMHLDQEAFQGLSARLIGRALTAELGLPIEPIDTPFNHNPLYRPLAVPRIARRPDALEFDPARFPLPHANDQYKQLVAIPQFGLLGDQSDMDDIAIAVARVLDQRNQLKSASIAEGTATR